MMSPAEAESAIAASVPRLPAQDVPLIELYGRVLRQVVSLANDQPPYDRVAMDGIALASSAWEQGIRSFRVAGMQAAGAAPLSLPSAQHCIEVMTGAITPLGCDCVIPVEKIARIEQVATLNAGVEPAPWMNIQRRALDGKSGTQVLQAGTVIGPAEVAVIASCGHATVSASRAPRIVVISTGDELVEPGERLQAWQIWRSNSYAAIAALTQHGFTQCSHDHLPDDLDVLRTRLQRHLEEHDVLVLSGGVSKGSFDFVPQVLRELGVGSVFHNVAQRPGKPMWFGVHAAGKAVYALPGNPVSTAICLRRYVLPGLLFSMGATGALPFKDSIALASDYKATPSLTSFVPVRLMTDERGHAHAHPFPTRGSGDFISLLGSDGFVELPARERRYEAGSVVSLYRW
jgi:molybdopterin molybdotransferase